MQSGRLTGRVSVLEGSLDQDSEPLDLFPRYKLFHVLPMSESDLSGELRSRCSRSRTLAFWESAILRPNCLPLAFKRSSTLLAPWATLSRINDAWLTRLLAFQKGLQGLGVVGPDTMYPAQS